MAETTKPGRARVVQKKTELVPKETETVIENAVTFIKNVNPGEVLVMKKPGPDGKGGKTLQFKGTRHITNDEEEIEFLTKLADAGNHHIFIVETATLLPKAPATQPPPLPATKPLQPAPQAPAAPPPPVAGPVKTNPPIPPPSPATPAAPAPQPGGSRQVAPPAEAVAGQ